MPTIPFVQLSHEILKNLFLADCIYPYDDSELHGKVPLYFIFSISLEHFSHTVSWARDENNLPQEEHFILFSSYINYLG